MRHTLILRYLTANADLAAKMFVQSAIGADTILSYIDVDNSTEDSKLAFETLQFLGILLLHDKFAVDFINRQGLFGFSNTLTRVRCCKISHLYFSMLTVL